MSRVKEFDPDVVLGQALDLFWSRGYESTSMADLVEHLGVGRASLYATFGNKRDLYLKALDRYLQMRDPNVVELLSRPGPALPAIRQLVRSYAEQAGADQDRRGCMVVNAAIETAPHNVAVTQLVCRSWQTIEVALTTALLRAQAQGELAPDADPSGLALFLLVLLQGMRVVGKGDPGSVRPLDAAVDQALTLLR